MDYDNELIAHKLRRWDKYLQNYKLPQWEEIPDLGLYMEQITTLLSQYLNYLPQELKDEQFITAATINNYVRKKVMPGPVKKRYYRMHIAYLIIICSLKQSMSITALQNLLPKEPSEEAIREVYENYILRYHQSCELFLQWVRQLSGPLLGHEEESEYSARTPDDLIISTAVASGYARLMAEKLLMLDGESMKSITDKKTDKTQASKKTAKADAKKEAKADAKKEARADAKKEKLK